MSYDDIAQEIFEQEEHIQQLERLLSDLINKVANVRQEIARRKRRTQELLDLAIDNSEGEIVSYAKLLAKL